jgi:hypothetical protein
VIENTKKLIKYWEGHAKEVNKMTRGFYAVKLGDRIKEIFEEKLELEILLKDVQQMKSDIENIKNHIKM